MEMISQNINETQEALSSVFCGLPIALAASENCLYILIKDLEIKLENFISTGETVTTELQVFPDADMHAMEAQWTHLGLTVSYRSQQMEYMYRQVTITYPQVSNPKTGMEISLIPWFMLPNRPYPTFSYIYAIWHYRNSDEKSQRLTAAATAKLFGLSRFNKSTVCRSIKAMEHLLETLKPDRPLSIVREAPATEDIISRIPKILKDCLSIESLKETWGDRVGQPPESIKAGNVPDVLSNIPQKCSKVLKGKGPAANGKPRDTRKRQGRPRTTGAQPVQRKIDFAPQPQLERIRKDFIVSCHSIVIDAAVTYHLFLL